MTRNERIATYFLAGTLIGVFLMLAFMDSVSAHHRNDITINNYPDEDHEHDYAPLDHEHDYNNDCLCVTNGLSDRAFANALTQSYASGAHELDYSTTDYQLSITYALQIDGEEEDAYSFKVGKRWESTPALFHVTINPEVENLGNTLVFGGTIRF
jgi:hypothetical protein